MPNAVQPVCNCTVLVQRMCATCGTAFGQEPPVSHTYAVQFRGIPCICNTQRLVNEAYKLASLRRKCA